MFSEWLVEAYYLRTFLQFTYTTFHYSSEIHGKNQWNSTRKSVQEYSAKVEKLGGRVTPKMPIPGMGYMVMCTDTENNGFGIFEADQTAK